MAFLKRNLNEIVSLSLFLLMLLAFVGRDGVNERVTADSARESRVETVLVSE